MNACSQVHYNVVISAFGFGFLLLPNFQAIAATVNVMEHGREWKEFKSSKHNGVSHATVGQQSNIAINHSYLAGVVLYSHNFKYAYL